MRLDTACSENDGSYTSRADWSRDRNRDREMGFSPSVSRWRHVVLCCVVLCCVVLCCVVLCYAVCGTFDVYACISE